MLERHGDGDIITTDQYWDCECEHNFIHPKECPICFKCGAIKEEQPDSRVNEVLDLGFVLPNEDPTFTLKMSGLKWLKKNVKLDAWPEEEWPALSPELSMNVYVDNDGQERATIFPVVNGRGDLGNPIEVV
jgi:hypothetical protein